MISRSLRCRRASVARFPIDLFDFVEGEYACQGKEYHV